MEAKQKRKAFWEQSFLTWQAKMGRRANLQEFAEYLEVGFTTLSGWFNSGYTPGADVIRKIAAKIGPEIYGAMDLQLDQLEEMRVRLEAAILEIQQTLAARSLDPGSEEGRAVASEIFSAWGFEAKVTITEAPVSLSSKT
jgi:transcriptional regulator with XRE-family HTH domain